MANSEAIINVLDEEDWQTKEDWNVNFHLQVEEYFVRSQKVQDNKRQGIVWLPVKLEDLLQIVQPVTTKPSQLKNEITPLLEEYDDLIMAQVR